MKKTTAWVGFDGKTYKDQRTCSVADVIFMADRCRNYMATVANYATNCNFTNGSVNELNRLLETHSENLEGLKHAVATMDKLIEEENNATIRS